MTQFYIRSLCVLCAAMLFAPMNQAAEPTATPGAWREDLAFLIERLPEVHPDIFHATPEAEFSKAAAELDSRIDDLDDAQIALAFSRLIALGRDSHTGIDLGPALAGTRAVPIQLAWLADGVFVAAVDKANEDLIGDRLVALQGVPIEQVMTGLGSLFAWENRSKLKHTAPQFFRNAAALRAVGIETKEGSIALTVEQNDAQRTVSINLVPAAEQHAWVSWLDKLPGDKPLAVRKAGGYYQSEFIEAQRVMYVAYNKCASAKDFPFQKFAAFVMDKSEELDARRMVIDLRHNGGGSEWIITPLAQALGTTPRFREPGAVIVLIGRRTFSSAVGNAIGLQKLGAVLIGEPTGGKPNHFGEVKSFNLPNSGLMVYHSTKFFKKVKRDSDAVHPAVLVEVSSADLFAGRDPALQAAYDYTPD